MKGVRRILAALVALPLLAVVALLLAGQRDGAGRNTERLAIASEMAGLLKDLGRKYREFDAALPARPSVLWMQSRLGLLRLEEESLERRVGFAARREKEEKDKYPGPGGRTSLCGKLGGHLYRSSPLSFPQIEVRPLN